MNKLILDFNDKGGRRYIFSKENYDKHKTKHPELLDTEFLQNHIKKTILDPDFIYPAYKEHNRFCFYLYDYNIDSFKWYTKVVVEKRKKFNIIVTAFRLNNIREADYAIKPCKRP